MSFVKDLSKGSKGENLLIDFLKKCDLSPLLNQDKEKRSFYDIYVEDPFLSFEVKFDFKSSVTGNIALEYYNPNSNKLSGISISQADYIAYIVYKTKVPHIYLSKRYELTQFMNDVKPFKNVCGGDNNNSYMLLYKKDVILGEPDSSCPLKNYTPEQFKLELNRGSNAK